MSGTQAVVAAARPAVAVRPAVAIRPALPADLAALSDFFAGLSAQSRYLRFFAAVTPGPALLRRLSGGAGALDAVIAVAGGVIIGHAMAADRAASRGDRMTDIGVVVADAWQGGGIGSALVRSLVTRPRPRRDRDGDGRPARKPPCAGHDRAALAYGSHRPCPGLRQHRDPS